MGAPLLLSSGAECVRFQQESFGALHQMVAGLSDEGRAEAWREIEAELGRFEGPNGFQAPSELLIAAGTKLSPHGCLRTHSPARGDQKP